MERYHSIFIVWPSLDVDPENSVGTEFPYTQLQPSHGVTFRGKKPSMLVSKDRLQVILPDKADYIVSMYNARGAIVQQRQYNGPGRYQTEMVRAGGLYVIRLTQNGRTVHTLPVIWGIR